MFESTRISLDSCRRKARGSYNSERSSDDESFESLDDRYGDDDDKDVTITIRDEPTDNDPRPNLSHDVERVVFFLPQRSSADPRIPFLDSSYHSTASAVSSASTSSFHRRGGSNIRKYFPRRRSGNEGSNIVNEINWPSESRGVSDLASLREQVATRRSDHNTRGHRSRQGLTLNPLKRLMGKSTTAEDKEDFNDNRKQFQMVSQRKVPTSDQFSGLYDRFEMRQSGLLFDDEYIESSKDYQYFGFIIRTFQMPFTFLILVGFVIYMFLVFIFTLMFVSTGNRNEGCFAGSGYVDYHDAFNLAWTTITTVGYGYTSPENAKGCGFLHFLCCAASFAGDVYAGVVAAIIFGKVIRIQRRAHVVFSDPITVQFGRALLNDFDKRLNKSKYPCPIMEFRVANRLFGVHGGEIMKARIGCVAIKNESMLPSEIKRDVVDSRTCIRSAQHTIADDDNHSKKNAQTKRTFYRVDTLSNEHPCFKRVWTVKHVLDEDSSLLTDVARRKIRECGGFWPAECNTWQEIRKSIQFDRLIVTFEGVSNVSASKVYAQKMYEIVDVLVGYDFANMLCRTKTGVEMNIHVISDIVEQEDGGSEPME